MANRVVVSQPGNMKPTFVPDQWNTGLFDCCDDFSSCCYHYWCFWCIACKTSEKYGECLCMPLVDFLGLGGSVPAFAMALRSDMRERYGIRGTMVEDFMFSSVFPACVYCQISRELKIRKQAVTFINTHHRSATLL
ncbi:cornifelin homolog B-like [Alosa sapidissima]|uniref:cornifelin homolog B-like n=1 Tax=Alosa sapidissima TaxID=34773 RepID=UPI001C07FC6E|nr:cornifelin homolog B-like [Alosa sapidissima]